VRALLDVNVLIALFDIAHVHHADAFTWWTKHRNDGWASCPLTQNGFVRIISGSRYPQPLTVADAIALMGAQMALPGHAFWPDDVSLADPKRFAHDRLAGPSQITDAYLLALAVQNDGRLVTFDRTIPLSAARGAEPRHVVAL
jgi:toxin-antitoxin system PIN domain toxin